MSPAHSGKRVLIVKTSSMGDVVHALPAVSDMQRALPGLQVDWVVEKSFAAIAHAHAGVSRVIPLQWRKWRKSLRDPATRAAMADWRQQMQAQRYDLVIDLQGLVKSALFACFANGPRAGYDWHSAREPLASLFYQRKAQVSREAHAVDRNRRLAAISLGYDLPASPPDFGLRRTHVEPGWPAPARCAVLVPCASRPEKLWPVERWIAVGRQLAGHGLPVVVLWGSPAEEQLAREIAAGCDALVPPFLTVAQVIDTLARASVVVGLDTGMTHIGAAHGCPTLGIYCDFEPGLAGVTGSGPVRSLGGRGQSPSLAEVSQALESLL